MVTLLLVIANLAVFAVEVSMGSDIDTFVRRWGLVPADLSQGPAAAVTLLTSAFLHTGWLHLASNVVYLGVFGLPVERRIGAARFAAMYVLSAIAGGLAYLITQPASQTPAIGASGAIAGVIAAYLVLYPRATLGSLVPVLFLHWVESTPALLLLLLWLVAQVLSSVASLTTSTGVAWWAHAGGFVAGLVIISTLRTPRAAK